MGTFNELVRAIEAAEGFKTYENGEHTETGMYSDAGILIYRYSNNIIIRYQEGHKTVLNVETDPAILNEIKEVI